MKIILAILLIAATMPSATAQKKNVFTINFIGKDIIRNKPLPDAEPLMAVVKKKTITEQVNKITITITEAEPKKDWYRVFIFNNEDGQEIYRVAEKTTSGTYTEKIRFPGDYKNGVVKIITMTLPKDEAVAATMRLRTFPLATITVN